MTTSRLSTSHRDWDAAIRAYRKETKIDLLDASSTSLRACQSVDNVLAQLLPGIEQGEPRLHPREAQELREAVETIVGIGLLFCGIGDGAPTEGEADAYVIFVAVAILLQAVRSDHQHQRTVVTLFVNVAKSLQRASFCIAGPRTGVVRESLYAVCTELLNVFALATRAYIPFQCSSGGVWLQILEFLRSCGGRQRPRNPKDESTERVEEALRRLRGVIERDNLAPVSQPPGDSSLRSTHPTIKPIDRWIDNELVYFSDIPWVPDWVPPTELPSTLGPIPPADVGDRLRTISVFALQTYLQVPQLDIQTLLSEDSRVLSGDKMAKLVLAGSTQHPGRSLTDFHNTIDAAVSAIDATMLKDEINLLAPYTPLAALFFAVALQLSVLARCSRAVFGDLTSYNKVDRSRILLGVIELARTYVSIHWRDSQVGLELDRLTEGGPAMLAFMLALGPTYNRSRSLKQKDIPKNHALHLESSCTCEFVQPPASVKELLSQGRIPVTVVEDGDEMRMKICDAACTPYVAISHVWADGLGSWTEKGLPRCQIKRLAGLARKVTGNVEGAFWIDSLCVPSDEDPSRKLAINLMASTYERASHVLVIDGGVRQQCHALSPKELMLVRIATSGWMERVWTLQEGMLAQRLWFEVADGVVDSADFSGATYSAALSLLPLLRHRNTDDESRTISPHTPRPPRITFNHLVPLLRHRRTWKPDDESLAVAGVLGLEVSKLSGIKEGPRRMRELLLQCSSISNLPRSVVTFGWDSERLDLLNFTWAHRSITRIMWNTAWADPFSANVSEEGLHGRFTVICLDACIDVPTQFPGFDVTVTMSPEADARQRALEELRDWEHVQATPELKTRDTQVTSGVDIVASPPYVTDLRVQHKSVRLNAVLIVRPGLPATSEDEALAFVHVPSWDSDKGANLAMHTEENPLVCHFACPGRLFVDSAGKRGPNRVVGDQAIRVSATMFPSIPILLK